MSEMFKELIKSSPFAIIDLYELHLDNQLHGTNEIYRFHNGCNQKAPTTGDIKWKGYSYSSFPIEVEGFEYTGNGQLPRPKVRIGNLLSSITALMIAINQTTTGNDLTGAKFIRIRTLSRFLDAENFDGSQNPYGVPDPTAEAPQEIYYVDRKVTENRDFVEFELAAAFDLAGVRAPKRQCISNICQWVYRSAECGYTGTRYFDESNTPLEAAPAPNFPAGNDNLYAGQSIFSEQQLVSQNGWYIARLGPLGDLFTRAKNQVVENGFLWQTKTSGSGGYRLTMQTDGNLVLYTAANQVVWETGTTLIGSPTSVIFNLLNAGGDYDFDRAWIPQPPYEGHRLAFFYEIMGAVGGAGINRTASETFNLSDGRSVTLQFTATSVALTNHWSGQSYGWTDTTTGSYPTATVTGSSGKFRTNETFYANFNLNGIINPFRGTPSGVLNSVGAAFKVTQTNNNANRAVIQNDGNLVVYDASNNVLWDTGVSQSGEPLAYIPNGTALNDVCGKRLSSCQARFGITAALPFGSFPGIGTLVS